MTESKMQEILYQYLDNKLHHKYITEAIYQRYWRLRINKRQIEMF